MDWRHYMINLAIVCWSFNYVQADEAYCTAIDKCSFRAPDFVQGLSPDRFLLIQSRVEEISEYGFALPSYERYLVLHRQDARWPSASDNNQLLKVFEGHIARIEKSKIDFGRGQTYRLAYHVGANGQVFDYFIFDPQSDPEITFIGGDHVYSNMLHAVEENGKIIAKHSQISSNHDGWEVTTDVFVVDGEKFKKHQTQTKLVTD